MDGVCCDMERMKRKIDLECCRRCWRKMSSVRAALAQDENEMMVILITTAGHECNFSTDIKFNSDEYLRLDRVAHNFIHAKGAENKTAE